jgi:hypothetical protein
VVEVGNDIIHLFLRVLPELPSGSYVHIHDIKFPYEYSEKRVIEGHRFWSERYLLHAFLLFNEEFEVVYGSKYMFEQNYEKLIQYLPEFEKGDGAGGSFWIKRN